MSRSPRGRGPRSPSRSPHPRSPSRSPRPPRTPLEGRFYQTTTFLFLLTSLVKVFFITPSRAPAEILTSKITADVAVKRSAELRADTDARTGEVSEAVAGGKQAVPHFSLAGLVDAHTGTTSQFGSYYSTDFEVHRNWLAITSTLPLKAWYWEKTSEWTLDYPPAFAYFESGVAAVMKGLCSVLGSDGNFCSRSLLPALEVANQNFNSFGFYAFHRLTVIFTDLCLVFAVRKWLHHSGSEVAQQHLFRVAFATFFVVMNAGLLIVDHMHFQYNGLLLGLLFLSAHRISICNHLQGAAIFTLLFNMKHIFLYVAPVFFLVLLERECFVVEGGGSKSSYRGGNKGSSSSAGPEDAGSKGRKNVEKPTARFSLFRFLRLGVVVLATTTLLWTPVTLYPALERQLEGIAAVKQSTVQLPWALRWVLSGGKAAEVVEPRVLAASELRGGGGPGTSAAAASKASSSSPITTFSDKYVLLSTFIETVSAQVAGAVGAPSLVAALAASSGAAAQGGRGPLLNLPLLLRDTLFECRQIFGRLFPFGRGLTHAYWAPNIWALYNFADRVLAKLTRWKSTSGTSEEDRSGGTPSSTSGLVETYQSSVLPTITPGICLLLTIAMYAAIFGWLFSSPRGARRSGTKSSSELLFYLAMGSAVTFQVGWHVHEKAILMVTLPLQLYVHLRLAEMRNRKEDDLVSIARRRRAIKEKFAAEQLKVNTSGARGGGGKSSSSRERSKESGQNSPRSHSRNYHDGANHKSRGVWWDQLVLSPTSRHTPTNRHREHHARSVELERLAQMKSQQLRELDFEEHEIWISSSNTSSSIIFLDAYSLLHATATVSVMPLIPSSTHPLCSLSKFFLFLSMHLAEQLYLESVIDDGEEIVIAGARGGAGERRWWYVGRKKKIKHLLLAVVTFFGVYQELPWLNGVLLGEKWVFVPLMLMSVVNAAVVIGCLGILLKEFPRFHRVGR